MSSQQPQPQIIYPTQWTYKVIGEDEEALREAVIETVASRRHDIAFSKTSSGKRYISMTLKVEVEDAEARLGIFEQLKTNESVKFVL